MSHREDLDAAQQHAREALALAREPGPNPLLELGLMGRLADVSRRRGELVEAKRLLVEAHDRYEREAPDADDHVFIVEGLARVHLDLGQHHRAIDSARRSIELRKSDVDSAVMIAADRFVLAKALWATGKRREALAEARSVLSGYERLGRDEAESVQDWLSARK